MSRMLTTLCVLLVCHTFSPAAQQRPDIVLVLADDMGFSDIGCYGGEIATPNLDRLARGGVRFSQLYNGARCCPTRAALLTGLYAHQAGMGCMEPDWGLRGYRGNINRECVTIAEALRANGYATYMAGKWHLTNRRTARNDADRYNWPLQRGFDRFYGTIAGAGSFFTPATLTRDNEDITAEARKDPSFYYTDAISANAARFIGEHAASRKERPFFLYVAYTAPHWPLHALEEDIEKYRGRYDRGWDRLRAERFARQKAIGLVDDTWKLSERPGFVPAWKDFPSSELPSHVSKIAGVTKENVSKLMAHRMAIYAAMVDRMDRGIGRVVDALRDSGRLENTLLVFLADNGACAEYSLYGFTNGRSPTIDQEGGRDSYTSYGGGWANASNTPFRYYKHDTYEGGIATPAIVHWPARVEGGGAWRTQIAHIIDVMPTFLAAADGEYPKSHAGESILPLEGVSLIPALGGGSIERPAPLFWEHHGNRAVRDGKWKLVARGETSDWELYDVGADRCETRDLAALHSAVVERLSSAYDAWAERCHVVTPSEIKRIRDARKKRPKAPSKGR